MLQYVKHKDEDVFIIITEPPFENWGIAGKQKSPAQ